MKCYVKMFFISVIAVTMSACETEEGLVLSSDPNQPTSVILEKKTQRVRTYDCYNQVVLDRIEVVADPVKTIEIAPTNIQRNGDIFKSQFQNMTSGDEQISIFGSTKVRVSLEGGSYLKVNEGFNELSYTYEFRTGGSESGRRYIFVEFRSVALEGILDRYPSNVECHIGG